MERIRERFTNGFKPFAIETNEGKRYEIPHLDFMAIGKGVVVVLGRADSVNTIDAWHILAVEDLPRPRTRRHG